MGKATKTRSISSAGAAYGLLADSLGTTPEAFSKVCKVSLKDLKALVHASRLAKADVDNEKPPTIVSSGKVAEALLEPCIERKDKSGSLGASKAAK